LFDVTLPLTSLEQAAQAFDQQVDQYLAGQPELRTEIEALAENAEEDPDSAPDPGPGSEPTAGELPRSEDVVRDLEAFLKNLRESQEDNPPPPQT
jgi:hypothetical protein